MSVGLVYTSVCRASPRILTLTSKNSIEVAECLSSRLIC